MQILLESSSCRCLTILPQSSRYPHPQDTIAAFVKILAGGMDDVPEAAFYMVGDEKEVMSKAEAMAKELQNK